MGVVSLSVVPSVAQADQFYPPELRVVYKTAERCGVEGSVVFTADNPGWIYDDVRIQRKRDGQWRKVARNDGTTKVYGSGSAELSERRVYLDRQSRNRGRWRAKYYYRYTSGGVVRKQGGLVRPFDEVRCKLG